MSVIIKTIIKNLNNQCDQIWADKTEVLNQYYDLIAQHRPISKDEEILQVLLDLKEKELFDLYNETERKVYRWWDKLDSFAAAS